MSFRRKEEWINAKQSMTAIILALHKVMEKLYFAQIPQINCGLIC